MAFYSFHFLSILHQIWLWDPVGGEIFCDIDPLLCVSQCFTYPVSAAAIQSIMIFHGPPSFPRWCFRICRSLRQPPATSIERRRLLTVISPAKLRWVLVTPCLGHHVVHYITGTPVDRSPLPGEMGDGSHVMCAIIQRYMAYSPNTERTLNRDSDLVHPVATVRHRRALRICCHLPNIRAYAHANAHTRPPP
jgi:hypothetical protein